MEPQLTTPNRPEAAKVIDVMMMTMTGGKERTIDEFKALLSAAGFTFISSTPTETEFHVIEAKR